MFKALCQRAIGLASAFLAVQKGSILIYTGAFMTIGVGGAALSIDIGRIVLLRTQMQNRADAGALAGAAQLDSLVNAVERAEKVVTDSMAAFTTSSADQSDLPVLSVTVHAAAADRITRLEPVLTYTADNDLIARFVVVTLEQRTLSFFYGPAAAMLSNQNIDNTTLLDAYAIAMSDPYVCKVQPMMICDPFEYEDPLNPGTWHAGTELFDVANRGKSLTLSPPPPGGGAMVGNFGFLQLPYDGTTTQGAAKIKAALAAEVPGGCYGVDSLTTAPGAMVGPVADGINTRFGDSPNSSPAPNVVEYPADTGYTVAGVLGDGIWEQATYWTDNHGTVPMPAVLADGPRYRTYLFEQGVTFYVRNGNGKETSITDLLDSNGPWAEVIPTKAIYGDADTIPVAPVGNSLPVSPSGQARRLMRMAVVACKSIDVTGASTVTSPGRYLEVFLTERAGSTAAAGGIIGEIVRTLSAKAAPEFHGNVRLVE